MPANGSMCRAIGQDFRDHFLVRESENIVEVALSVLRVAACVRAAEDRQSTARSKEIAQCIRGQRRLRECTDEDYVNALR